MSPLFDAVSNGCAAGRHQEVLQEILFRRIFRGHQCFVLDKLGAWSATLGALSAFFETPWEQPVAGLEESWKGFVLNTTSWCLRGLGRPQEAIQPVRAALKIAIAMQTWSNAAVAATNLSALYLTIGDLPQAVAFAQHSVELADQSNDEMRKMVVRTVLAHALHQFGCTEDAATAFREAEEMQKQEKAAPPFLYSEWGSQYCDLLLDQGQIREAKERAAQALAWAKEHLGSMDIALGNLSLGRALLFETQETSMRDPTRAAEFLQRAVEELRQAAMMDYLSRGLLAYAALHRVRGDYARAERDLTEALRITTRGGMGLNLADCHLELAQLQLAQGKRHKAREHWVTANEMIERMGYHRRDKEVKALEQQLG
jgi:tetratricopeptide (TPR) repeat protein